MNQTGSRRPCAFCGQLRKLTKEHLFRDSLKGRIPASSELARRRTDSNGFDQLTDMPVSIFDLEVREVCAPCNHGWMNDIDARIEDLLVDLANGSQTSIPAARIADFARWATRIALLRTLSERPRFGHARASLFRDFFESQLPPANTFIRMAMQPPLSFEGGSNSHARIGDADSDPSEAESLNIVNWGIGYLFVHVVLASGGGASTLARGIDHDLRPMNKAMPRVWPGKRRAVSFTTLVDATTLDHLSSLGFLLNRDRPAPGPYDA
ncbi:hypothetical protein PFZ55_39870 [Streptomyces sp. MS2A]|nr:hypothetical protein [Streptomyces sp. MS2A]